MYTYADDTKQDTALTGQARRPHHDKDTRNHIARVERVADQQRKQGWMNPVKVRRDVERLETHLTRKNSSLAR